MIAYLGLGANLGDPQASLAAAASHLDRVPGIRVLRLSPAYRSRPHGPAGQPDYLNAVAEVDTDLEPVALLAAAQAVERTLGRKPCARRWGPRVMDIDVLLIGDRIVDSGGRRHQALVVPHPRIAERRFVLRPLADLAPDLRHPTLGRSIAELLASCPDAPLVAGPWTLPRTVNARTEDHGGDLALRVAASRLIALFEHAALGLVATILDRDLLREEERRETTVALPRPVERLRRAEVAEVLADVLTEILVWLDADGWLPARVTVLLDGASAHLVAFGQRIAGRGLAIERYPKAVTRHGLRVQRRGRGRHTRWTAYLVLDM